MELFTRIDLSVRGAYNVPQKLQAFSFDEINHRVGRGKRAREP
jgi:hypothetical protein